MNLLRVRGQFAPGPKRYDALLQDPLVSDWISVYRSASTRRNYLSSLHVVCVRSGLSPGRLLELESDDARRVVMDVVRDYLKQDKLVSARLIQTAVKSFYENNDRAIKFKRVDRVRYARKKVAYEVIPSRDQI